MANEYVEALIKNGKIVKIGTTGKGGLVEMYRFVHL